MKKKILNVGSLNIDYVYQVPHFVQPGETLSSTGYARYPGGKGLNQSVALARAGAEVHHVGHVGVDGAWLVDFLKQNGAGVSHLSEVEGPTGHAIIQVNTNGQNCILIEGGANRKVTASNVSAAIKELGFEVGDYLLLQNETSSVAEIIALAVEKGIKVVFNPAPMDKTICDIDLSSVFLLVVNEVEAAELAGQAESENYEQLLALLKQRYPKTNILLTLGSRGSVYSSEDGASNFEPAKKVVAVDTTAAGDTFIGYFLARIAEGAPVAEAMRLATCASAICVSLVGAAPSIPHISELS
jgi:ribokinase